MPVDQLFVGAVAFILGLLALIAAIHNRDWYFRLPKARWIENRWGRTTVRVVYAFLGIALIALGIVIVSGDRRSERMNERQSVPLKGGWNISFQAGRNGVLPRSDCGSGLGQTDKANFCPFA